MKRVLTALAATLCRPRGGCHYRRGTAPANQLAGDYHVPDFRGADAVHYVLGVETRALRNDYYTAGGNITGFQNGLAIAGDFMSAASFLDLRAGLHLRL